MNKVCDCENCFFYDDYTLTCCCHKECDDPSLDISECEYAIVVLDKLDRLTHLLFWETYFEMG